MEIQVYLAVVLDHWWSVNLVVHDSHPEPIQHKGTWKISKQIQKVGDILAL